jgi:S-formylglutathione hydrolase FrmB
MKSVKYFQSAAAFCIFLGLISQTGCTKTSTPPPDQPRLTAGVVMRDMTFRSKALKRDMPYRVVFPASITTGRKLRVVYLLHGGGGGFHDWTNYSDVAKFAEQEMILVMPEGNSSYYMNAALRPQDRYEDYVIIDLIADVEAKLPVAVGRSNRAIVGISMGGFGAVDLSLKHPELFVFTGALSAVLDVPSRPFFD